ncbi:glutamate racemase [Corynebacterium sp. 153RC1]|uniref:glutamate racemase n=1 Tax=unclassified Corynebacterium TaxID=2624378 RepID=UPI00211C6B1E|nr:MULTISPECIES: glutamate racemase [unclassified Corynebacterium]MCQ9370873.1 glutamate racemase [Corynebacterium sp. 35RC1]MCQ9353202.1 glutamate racemase [Corynebacterium sp. 209RC1]MCQ9355503.1 glutamate racemase [Corynebacterium sp. 1222RC1]MCQ9357700.1 glutamate racemase [Corynebacterium sp. 122RC1]MCQ9359907.1 glutamate racemase [Corynebacterium sp. 142RC1]
MSIGVFDSGVGGLTVARALIDQLPGESITYIGDTLNAPYGPRSTEEVRRLSLRLSDELVSRGSKMVVIACNTATAAMLEEAQQRYEVPVVGVISPAVRRALASTRNGKVGVIGTEGTIASGAYQQEFAKVNPEVEVFAQACPSFVSFVERGITAGRQVLQVAEGYVEPLQAAGVDTLVLGCTHYPLLSGVIQLAMGDHVQLVSSAEETAKDVFKLLSQQDLLAQEGEPVQHTFEATGDPEHFAALAQRFLGPHVTHVGNARGV